MTLLTLCGEQMGMREREKIALAGETLQGAFRRKIGTFFFVITIDADSQSPIIHDKVTEKMNLRRKTYQLKSLFNLWKCELS